MLCVRQPGKETKEIKTNISACIAIGTGHNAQLSPSLDRRYVGQTISASAVQDRYSNHPQGGVGGGGGLGGGGGSERGRG